VKEELWNDEERSDYKLPKFDGFNGLCRIGKLVAFEGEGKLTANKELE
jgi:hypothetical protein